MRHVQYHGVSSVEITEIGTYRQDQPGNEFYSRKLSIKMDDGSIEEFDLFSDNGYNLLVDDKEIDSLQSDDLLKAA